MAADDGGLGWLPAADRVRFTRWAHSYEGAKLAEEMRGLRPRRFSVRLEPAESLASPPPPGSKRLRCLRHGEGVHNVYRARELAAGRQPHAKRGNFDQMPADLYDPPLTSKGELEAEGAKAGAELGQDPELLVTSPLRRACKTGLIAFARAVENGVPVIAHEMARENYKGLDPSIYDAHRGSDELAAEFPGVDFSMIPGPAGPGLQADPIWWGYKSQCGDVLEVGDNEASHASRAWHLMCWIMDRYERDVALATHSLFLLSLFHGALDQDDGQGGFQPPASAQIFRTGELRSVLVTERPAPTRPPTKAGGGPRAPRKRPAAGARAEAPARKRPSGAR